MDKNSTKMFKQIVNAFLHMQELDKECEDYLLKEIQRVKEGLKPSKEQLPKPCIGCGKPKKKFKESVEAVEVTKNDIEDVKEDVKEG